MQFTADCKTLQDKIKLLQSVSEKKSGIPILASILIEAQDNKLILTSTDLDVILKTSVDAEVKEEGAVAISSKRLYDILKNLKEGTITFKKESNDWARLSCRKSKFRLQGLSKQHFPKTPDIEGNEVIFAGDTLKSFIQRTYFAVSDEVNKYTLNGAKFELGGGKLTMVGTDGLRIAVSTKDFESDETIDTIIPKAALVELEKFLGEEASFKSSSNHVSIESGDFTLIARKLSGIFPDYKLALPKDNKIKVKVNSKELASAIRRVALMSDADAKAISITVKENELELKANVLEEAEETIECETENFKDITFIVNWKFLVDFLDATTEATIHLKDAKSSIKVEEGDAFCLIMPLRK